MDKESQLCADHLVNEQNAYYVSLFHVDFRYFFARQRFINHFDVVFALDVLKVMNL